MKLTLLFFMKRVTSIAINIVLTTVSIAIVLFVVDLTLKALKLPSQYRTILLLSGSKLFTDEHGVRRYEPSKDVEQAALVDGEISYRYKYRTNNLGFVSKYDLHPGESLDLMIVGDSVSEGQEVGPWLDVVQKKLFEDHGKTSQNMAIAGNGFVDFERASAYAKNSLKAHKAMLIFIGDDMHRPGDVMHANEDCSAYKTFINADVIDCFTGQPTWHHYDSNLSDADLVRFAESRQRLGLVRLARPYGVKWALAAARRVCSTGLRLDMDWWLARRYTHECVIQEAEEALKARTLPATSPVPPVATSPVPPVATSPVPPVEAATIQIPAYSVTALEKILRLYGPKNVLLVTIPGGGMPVKDMHLQTVFNSLVGSKFNDPIQYADLSESCDMPRELWAPRLGPGSRKGYGHPTPEGYLKLQSCILSSERVMKFAVQ
jgi:hypothetical protein